MEEQLKKLEEAAKKLNVVSNNFNKEIKNIETYINLLSLGITTSVKFKIGEESYLLAYGRVKNVYNLFVATDNTVIKDWKLIDAPRLVKIEAINYLPDLLERLNKLAIKTTKKLEEKTVEAREMAEAIRKVMQDENIGPITPNKRDSTKRR